jgi:hypothetical protein
VWQAIAIVSRVSLAYILLVSAVAKTFSRMELVVAVERLTTRRMAPYIAAVIVICEFGGAVALPLGPHWVGGIWSAGLFAGFGAYAALPAARSSACGCLGALGDGRGGAVLATRNLALAVAALAVGSMGGVSPLNAGVRDWLIAVSVGSVAMLVPSLSWRSPARPTSRTRDGAVGHGTS